MQRHQDRYDWVLRNFGRYNTEFKHDFLKAMMAKRTERTMPWTVAACTATLLPEVR
jgi:hypothetical protein